MTAAFSRQKKLLKKGCLLFFIFSICSTAFSQQSKVDSLGRLLAAEKSDTSKVTFMWQMADAIARYDLDSAVYLAQEALYLARNKGYKEGESRSLGILSNTFRKMGNYPRALELNFEKLRLEEKRQVPRNLASVLMNIGIVYVFQEEYRLGLEYYRKADSVINQFNVTDFKWNIVLNIGDVYDRLNISDSALIFFNKSLALAKPVNNDKDIENYRTGKSMTGLGHSYRRLGSYQQALNFYRDGLVLIQAATDNETFCEATLGLAKLYRLMRKNDSANYYANLSIAAAKKDGFLPQELEAAEFLTELFKERKNLDSAFSFINYVQDLNDSVNSKTRIRQLQMLSSDEHFRQRQLDEDKKTAQKKRLEQLQLLLIALFIPLLFLLTLLMSRVKIHTKAIRLLGILSLLFLFEYLTLLLHPAVARLTNHSPLLEILIFVVLAAILIPTHHRLEHWMIHKLSRHHHKPKQAAVNPELAHTDNKKSPY